MTLQVTGTNVVNQNRTFVLGTATPGSPATGMIRYNSSLTRFEVYNGTEWVAFLTTVTSTPPAWSWGNGFAGGLGSGNVTNRSSPVTVVGGFTDWALVVAGYQMGAGIRLNGQMWTWGSNSLGKLGDLTTTSKSSPVSVSGNFSDWVSVSMGNGHTVGLRANGTVWCWGAGSLGRAGDGFTSNNSSPRSVSGGFTDWVQITAGHFHSIGIRSNGQAWVWGYNGTAGRLGDGTITDRSSPVSVVGGFTDWINVAGGSTHSAGVRANGSAWCWGNNTQGELGDNTLTAKSSPVSVVGGITDWVQISAGTQHTMALRSNGQIWGWGRNPQGQLGDNTIVGKSSPVSVVGGITDWVQVSAGVQHNIALRATGQAYGWGYNGAGRLGDNSTTSARSPVLVVGGFTDWVQISAGCGSLSAGSRAV